MYFKLKRTKFLYGFVLEFQEYPVFNDILWLLGLKHHGHDREPNNKRMPLFGETIQSML